jgi:WD40 repeat protein
MMTLKGHTSTVWALDWNARGDRLVTVSDDLSLRVWSIDVDAESYACVCVLDQFHTRPIHTVAWSPLTDRILTGGGDDMIAVLEKAGVDDDASWCVAQTIPNAHASDVNCVKWHPMDPSIFGSAGDDFLIKVWTILE